MVEYLNNYIEKLRTSKDLPAFYLVELHRELMRLDPRDFEPNIQHDVMSVRARLEYLMGTTSRHSTNDIANDLNQIVLVLNGFRGDGSHGKIRNFAYILDDKLRRIIERDYFELKVKLYPSGAWKSTVVLSGSILEVILFARLEEPSRHPQALLSPSVPKYKGANRPFEDWKLFDLINVAVDVGLIPKETRDTIHQVLREYRNLIHPLKEKDENVVCTEAEGMQSVGTLDGVCNYLEAHP